MKLIHAVYLVILVLLAGCNNSPSFGVVDIERAFEDYQLQKDLRKELESFILQERLKIDSLSIGLNELASKMQIDNMDASDDDVRIFNEQYTINSQVQSQIEKKINLKVNELDQTINNRLEALIPVFAERMEVDALFSKGGSYPATLFSKQSMDMTDEFILFINQEYNGQVDN